MVKPRIGLEDWYREDLTIHTSLSSGNYINSLNIFNCIDHRHGRKRTWLPCHVVANQEYSCSFVVLVLLRRIHFTVKQTSPLVFRFCFAVIVWQIIFEGFLPKPHWQTFQQSSLQPSDWRISYILQPFHGFLRAEKQREGQIIAFQIKVSKAARAIAGDKRIRQSLSPGISLRRPISANPELNFNPGIFFWPFDLLCVDSFSPSNI